MQLNRRQFVGGAAALTATLAGCSDSSGGSNPDNSNPDDSDPSGGNDGSNEEESQTLEIADETVEVEEDEYQYYRFTLNRQATLSYSFTVRSGPPIDVVVLNEEEFNHYENGDRFRPYEGSTKGDTSGSGNINLASGEYYLVVDNTDAGTSPPSNLDDDVAEVEIQATAE